MLREHLKIQLTSYLEYEPTQGQQDLFDRITGFISRPAQPEILLVRGYSGTGKTTSVRALVRLLDNMGHSSVLLAPTGRAAKVLSEYTGKEAYTIHKKIYRQKSSKDGFGKFVLNYNRAYETIFVVDEASMISNCSSESSLFGSGALLNDLIDFVFGGKRCKLILIGDTAQLPPVGTSLSEALDKEKLEHFGYPVTEVLLDEVVRQAKDSGIHTNATVIRRQIANLDIKIPRFKVEYFKDICRISGREVIELLEDYYQGGNPDDTIIIVRSNKMANKYNEGIRRQIMYKEEQITAGDMVMVVKNNYYWLPEIEEADFIANGDILHIDRIHGYEERYGYHFADVTVSFTTREMPPLDVKVLLDTLWIDSPSLTSEQNKELFYRILENYPAEKNKKKAFDQVRNDPFFNALQIKFAYAITCHKAQGGQWKTVFLDQGFIPKEQITIEYLRWLYTAVTRATDKLYLVNFPDYYF